MSDATEIRETAQGHRIFARSCCRFISFEITTKKQDVDLDGFLTATRDSGHGTTQRSAVCSPRNPSSDYHLHVSWHISDSDFQLTVEFVKGAIDRAAGEGEPYAEQFVDWAGRFFAMKVHTAFVEADFRYPLSERKCRFPLPMKVAIGPNGSEVTIDGVSFVLPANFEGLSKIYLTQAAKTTTIHLHAKRAFDFTTFDPQNEVAALDRAVSAVLEEKKQ